GGRHDGGSDERNIIERKGKNTKCDGVRKPEQACPNRGQKSDPKIDDCQNSDIAGKIALDVVENAQDAQSIFALGRIGYQITSKLLVHRQKEEECSEKQENLADRGR